MAKETTGTAQRLSIPLTDDGLVDFDHMRPSTAAKLVELIKTDPTIRDTYNDVNAPAGDGPDVFGGITAENVGKGLDALCTVNAMVFRVAAAKFIKHPLLKDAQGQPVPLVLDPDILDQQFGLSAKQHAELDPRATRLAEKYSDKMPQWLKDNLDLYIFVSTFLAYTAQNAKTVLSLQIQRDLKAAQYAHAQRAAAQAKQPQTDSDAKQPPQRTNGLDQHAVEPISIMEEPEQPAA